MKEELTQEQKRIKIAKACGIEWCDGWIVSLANVFSTQDAGYVNKNITMMRADGERVACRCLLPDYLSDLNAMHEAEKVLTEKQEAEFRVLLLEVCGGLSDALHATATQRAEAFGKALNIW